ncbi:hypothetical protein C0991_008383 [Blastosporella zonata]|nr:hypothetical protein C0991_008383 [Blastosporella zonata]
MSELSSSSEQLVLIFTTLALKAIRSDVVFHAVSLIFSIMEIAADVADTITDMGMELIDLFFGIPTYPVSYVFTDPWAAFKEPICPINIEEWGLQGFVEPYRPFIPPENTITFNISPAAATIISFALPSLSLFCLYSILVGAFSIYSTLSADLNNADNPRQRRNLRGD